MKKFKFILGIVGFLNFFILAIGIGLYLMWIATNAFQCLVGFNIAFIGGGLVCMIFSPIFKENK